MALPIDSFFHEVAFREMNAARGQLPFKEPRWRRIFRALSPAVRRTLLLLVTLALAGAAWRFHKPLVEYLRSKPAHPPGAADTLAVVVHRSAPAERLYRLAQTCARENAGRACQEALQQLAAVAEPALVLRCLHQPEIAALRANAFFDDFAAELEQRYGQPSPPPVASSPGQGH